MYKAYLLFTIFIFFVTYSFAQKQYNLGNTTIEVSSLKQDIAVPWEIVWAPDNHIWMTHENGKVSRVNPTNGDTKTVLQIPDMYASNDLTANRMVGITIGSDFSTNPFVYINYVYRGTAYTSKNWTRYEKIVRYTYNTVTETLTSPFVLIDGIKVYDGWRIGGKLLISPDNDYLFLTIGDAKQPDYPENHPEWNSETPKPLSLESFSGKIIRIKTDGTIPTDNPFYENNDKSNPKNLIWSYGHRNTQGLVFSDDDRLYYSEHGANGNDEFGEIIKGGNYGWPLVQGMCDTPEELSFCNVNNDYVSPITDWVNTIAPSNMEFYNYEAIPEWQNAALVATLTAFSGEDRAGEDIRVLTLNQGGSSVTQESILFDNEYLRIRDLCVSPTGEVFFTTSNTIMNGGLKNPTDDHIYRIRAVNASTENSAPTDILLSSNNIIENEPIGSKIGDFSSIDIDAEDTHIYTLVAGEGSTGNGAFYVENNQLLSNEVFNFSENANYSIRVQTDDQAGGTFEKSFTITVVEETGNYFKIEMEESNFEVLSNVGGNGAVEVFSEPITDQGTGRAIILPDDGDRIGLDFTISQAGRYKIRVGTRSGDARSSTSFWFDEQSVPLDKYIFTLDGDEFAIAGDKSCPDIYFTSNWGNSWWGPMINTIQFLEAGEHRITIEANASWLGIDYIELEYVPNVTNRLEFEDNFTVLSDQGAIGEPRSLYEETIYDCDGGLAVMVWDVGDKIAKDFDIINTGKYSFQVRLRTGDADGSVNLLNSYTFFLDGTPIDFLLDENSLLKQETWGQSTWGIVNFEVENLTAGTHQLSMESQGTFLGLDYLELALPSDSINFPPSDIVLSNNAVNENLPIGTLVGELSTIDANINDHHTYALTINNYPGNAFFKIENNQLLTNAIFDFETKNNYSIGLLTTDSAGASLNKEFDISILDVFENTPPSDILLTKNTVFEDEPLETVIGDFSTVDPDEDYHFYEFVEGVGGNDNSVFKLIDNTLVTNLVFDFETQNKYSIRVSTNDRNGGILEKVFAIEILEAGVNNPPTEIVLSNNSLIELLPSSTLIGTLTTIDADEEDEHTYTLVNGEGASDNNSFIIEKNELLSNTTFDFEEKSDYSIRIRSTDIAGDSIENTFAISILDSAENKAPTNIIISDSTILENESIGTIVGNLETEDTDAGDIHSYQLVEGTGSDDNLLFTIEGNQLKSNEVFDYETRKEYTIRLKSTDQEGAQIEKIFQIQIVDVFENEAPTNISLSANKIAEKKPAGTIIGTFETDDKDNDDQHAYALVNGEGDGGNTSFSIDKNQLLSNKEFDFETQSTYSIRIKSTDLAGAFIEKTFEINILDSAENTPPSDILLSNSSIEEKQPLNTVIGEFRSLDADSEDRHRFSLVPGEGDEDNFDFAIADNILLAKKSFDYAAKNAYSIRVRTYDNKDDFFEKIFFIEVIQENRAPVLNVNLQDQIFNAEEAFEIVLDTNLFLDPDNDPLTISALLDKSNPLPNWLNFKASTLTFKGNPTQEHQGVYQIYLIAEDGRDGKTESNFSLSIEAPLSNQEFLFDNKLIVYPNPVDKLLFIEVENNELGNLQIEIYSLDGKRVFSKKINKNKRKVSESIDVSSLTHGVYFVVLETPESIKQKRIIKIDKP